VIATVADYRLVTGDAATSDPDVTAALERAQARAEELCEREFDLQSRTETAPIDADGHIWPLAYPITAVTVPDGATIADDGFSLLGPGAVGFADLFEDVWGFPVDQLPGSGSTGLTARTVPTSYTGGYAPGSAPQGLVDAICELASRYAAPADTRGVPAGVTSVTTGGAATQSFSGRALGGSSGIPASLRAQIRLYRHVQARSAD
jgi:hypothetical protein